MEEVKNINDYEALQSRLKNLELENKILFKALLNAQEEIFKIYGNPKKLLDILNNSYFENIKKEYRIKAADYLLRLLNNKQIYNKNIKDYFKELISKKKLEDFNYNNIKEIYLKEGKKGIERYIEPEKDVKERILKLIKRLKENNQSNSDDKFIRLCLELAVPYDILCLKDLIIYLHKDKKDILAYSLMGYLPKNIKITNDEEDIFKEIESIAYIKLKETAEKKIEKLQINIRTNPFKSQFIYLIKKIYGFSEKAYE